MTKTNKAKHRSLEKTKLGGLDWEHIFRNTEKHEHFQELDTLATKHLQKFWENYNLQMKMGVEHKMASVAIKTSHLLKAHYLQLIWNQNELKWNRLNFAIRGARLEKNPEFLHPMYHLLLKLLLEEGKLEEIPLEYYQRKLLKLAKWRQIQNSTEKTEQEKSILPGEEIKTTARFKLFNTYFPLDTLKEYQKRKNRAIRKEYKNGFEIYFEEGIDTTIKMMEQDILKKKPITHQHPPTHPFWGECEWEKQTLTLKGGQAPNSEPTPQQTDQAKQEVCP